MDLLPEIAELIPNEAIPKLSQKFQEAIQAIDSDYRHHNKAWSKPGTPWIGTPPARRYLNSLVANLIAFNTSLIYDNGNGRKIAVTIITNCLKPISSSWQNSLEKIRDLLGFAKNPRVLKFVTKEEKESMLKSGEIQWEAMLRGSCPGRPTLESGEPIKWENDIVLSYLKNPGVSNVPLLVELDTGEIISLGVSGGFILSGRDSLGRNIYDPAPGWQERARELASKASIIIKHPRVVRMKFGWFSGKDPAEQKNIKNMTPDELLKYLGDSQPNQTQTAQNTYTASAGGTSVTAPGGTFIASDWAWCVTRFPNNPVQQQQCLADLQNKSESKQELPPPEIVGAGASAGTLAVLILAAWIAYLLLKGR